ncbi:MAG: transposase [Patescibacteria group bacterium]
MNLNKLNRKKNRFENYNYSQSGWYFVTICVKNKEKFFGEIKNNEMILNECGKIIKNQWLWLKKQFCYIQLDEYVIMPNHIHGILVITNDNGMDKSRPVPTKKIKSLSELIGAFKTTSSKLIHKNELENFQWQRSFYDHIIRNEKSLNNIREYIDNNPLKWTMDRNNIY